MSTITPSPSEDVAAPPPKQPDGAISASSAICRARHPQRPDVECELAVTEAGTHLYAHPINSGFHIGGLPT